MESTLPALLENNLGFALATGFITLLGFSIKILKGAFDFHYEYFTRRHLRRMTDLLPQVDPDSLLHHFLKQAISIEVFKIASGLKTTSLYAAALMHLCKFKRISPNRVKHFVRHIEIRPDGHVSLSINTMDKVAAYYSVTAAAVIFIFGGYAFVTSFAINEKYGWIAGAVMFLICSIAVRFFLKDWRNYQEVKRIQSDLLANPLPISEECQAVACRPTTQAETTDQAEIHPVKGTGHTDASVAHSAAQIPQPNAVPSAVADPASA
ncbi:MAG: hypothetical protein Q8R10_05610 [Pseudomonas sp.]|uniref:hypothetical protein n=1 Tax=Pseudomonas sp. TaxID=306 RepID=UPI0027370FE3|nr:hypothetical protein [Pseudomonas sp.]MDP3845885.1 hypothetical protein [Pseudomonas sp.]